jgi:3-hydroxyisobutyrate dehydrogenase-like beta-hydroxyacid dehydrogenase
MDIGFVGLGSMGSGMARRLVGAGHRVKVWNRSPGPAEALAKEGAEPVSRPEAAFGGEAVVSMLANDAAVREVVLGQGLPAARPGLLHLSMSTITVKLCQEMEAAHARAGVLLVGAPVLGRPDVAAAGQLNILAAGEEAAVEKAAPLLAAMGRKTWRIGPRPHQASLVKLAVNFSLAAAIEAMSEAFALVEAHGLDPHIAHELMSGTLFAAPAYQGYGRTIADRAFEPAGFKLPLGLKDVRSAMEAGEAVGAPMPFASVMRDNFLDAIAHGDSEKDWSAVSQVARRRAGLV